MSYQQQPQQQHQQQYYQQQPPHPQQQQMYQHQHQQPHPQQQQAVYHQPSHDQHQHQHQHQPVYAAQPAGYQAQLPMQASAHYVQVAKPNGWQNSLMDCSPCDNCLLGTFLPCMLLGKTSERQRDQTLQTYDTCNSDCLTFCGIQCVTGCGWIYVMMKRSEIREKFGIEGDGMGDCCVAYWCSCCALIQQDNEVAARMPPNVAQGYQAQGGMVMPSK